MKRPRRFNTWRAAMLFATWAYGRHFDGRHSVRRVPGAYGLPVWEVRPL